MSGKLHAGTLVTLFLRQNPPVRLVRFDEDCDSPEEDLLPALRSEGNKVNLLIVDLCDTKVLVRRWVDVQEL